MWDPASQLAIDEAVEMAGIFPGTPVKGVGEIQVFVNKREDGRRWGSMLEVVELEPGRRAVARSLMEAYPSWSVLTLEPLGSEACRLTQEFWIDLPQGTFMKTVRELRRHHREGLQTLMRRLGDLASDDSR